MKKMYVIMRRTTLADTPDVVDNSYREEPVLITDNLDYANTYCETYNASQERISDTYCLVLTTYLM